jgi:hypothetical protein
MSDDTKTPAPAPAPAPAPSWYKPYLPLLTHLLIAVLAALATRYGVPPIVVEVLKEVPVPVVQAPAAGGDGFAPTFGWHADGEEIAANLDRGRTLHFAQTDAGKVALGDEDVFLWRAVRKAAKLPDDKYPNVNQQSVGCCVGCGWKHSADVCQATAIASGKAFEFKPVSVEVIYAGSRVEVGGGRISGDGSMGTWAAKWCRERGGLVPMGKYPAADLTTFSPSRARSWGRTGVPDDLEPLAKEHPVKGCALVTTWADVKRSVQQGYPVAVCSDQGFRMERDATGRCRPQGTWPHCMAIIGVRVAKDGRSEAGFILNSWGDQAHTGPVWPPDAPVAGFWADASVIDRMVRQGDSFALADVAGFPARHVKPDWFVRALPRPERRLAPEDLFALAP